VEIGAVIASVKLARTLTGTVHDLYTGTKRVESGDFAHRIPVRSNDQLSELASSFNAMTARVEQLIEEVKEKEKLESELEIARQVQAQLFPKEIPKLATLELAGLCNPARVVSGDYYDFIALESRAAVVIGDISGKGISAALLMASVQASLHAQLSMDSRQPSTSTLVTRLNRQLYESTPPEKYATFYCAVYDDTNNQLSYTNAGHLAPILIRGGASGEVLRLESNGTVVGMFPDYPFEQCDLALQTGDLLAAFTDGITESENAQEEQFGEARLIELLRRDAQRPLEEIIENVMTAVSSWAHDPSMRDDITILLARKL
jgi:sigma-B regulation protein RsbU (phosphoserine phosphatase)